MRSDDILSLYGKVAFNLYGQDSKPDAARNLAYPILLRPDRFALIAQGDHNFVHITLEHRMEKFHALKQQNKNTSAL